MQRLFIKSDIDELRWPAIPDAKGALIMSILFQLERSQWWPPEKLLAWQLHQLGAVLGHAYETTPFYRDRLGQAGIKSSAAPSLEAWAEIPILTRAEVQEADEDLISDEIPESHGYTEEVFTSGSTGQPIRAVRTELTNRYSSAFTIRDHLWHGRDMGGKLAAIRDSEKGVDPYPDGSYSDYWGSSSGSVFATGPCVALNVMCTVEQQIEWLQRVDPDYFLTHPTIVEALARHAIAEGIRIPNLKQVETIAELLRPATRLACREAWGVPVIDMYTTREIGYIALQCPEHETYHVQSEDVLVEILDDDGLPCGPGEVGRVVLTPLHNFAMPLIRYEIGDYAEVGEPCPCGRGLPVLKRILGRKQNMMILPSGEEAWPLLSSSNIAAMLEVAPIRQYQIVQKALDLIELRLVTERALEPSEEAALGGWVGERFGEAFRVEITLMDEIPRSRTGKIQDFLCEVSKP